MTETLPVASDAAETMQPMNPELYVYSASVKNMLEIEQGEARGEPAPLPPGTSAKDLVGFEFQIIFNMFNCSL